MKNYMLLYREGCKAHCRIFLSREGRDKAITQIRTKFKNIKKDCPPLFLFNSDAPIDFEGQAPDTSTIREVK